MRKAFTVVGQDSPAPDPELAAAAPEPADPPEPVAEPAPSPAGVPDPEPAADAAPVTLEQLAEMSSAELHSLFRASAAPTSLAELEGDWTGRVLAGHGALAAAPTDKLLRWLGTRPPVFPWNGKTFTADGDREGHGHNRIQVAGERTVARFATRLGASLTDGRGCVLLDYDVPSNPFIMRPMRDELRRLSDDLYFGPAMWRVRGDLRPLAFFALSR